MRTPFAPWHNTVFRVALAAAALGAAGGLALLMLYPRTPFATRESEPIEQPIPFDHRHHVVDDGIDCRYCHDLVERAPTAGVPPTSVCMNCHAQIWNQGPLLAPVRQSFFSGRPLQWRRVNRLPEFVYFNHAIHVAKGVGCATCHGRVDRMAAVQQAAPFTMGWCLDCHRDPAPRLRPREEITNMAWQPPDSGLLARELAARYDVHARTSCTTCHR